MDREIIDLQAKRLEKRIPELVEKVETAMQLLNETSERLVLAKRLLVQVEQEVYELHITNDVGEE